MVYLPRIKISEQDFTWLKKNIHIISDYSSTVQHNFLEELFNREVYNWQWLVINSPYDSVYPVSQILFKNGWHNIFVSSEMNELLLCYQ